MPLEEIDGEWLEIMLFNGAIGPNGEDKDVDAPLLVTEALEEAPEARRGHIAAMLEIALPQMVTRLQAQRLPIDQIAEVEGVVRDAILELRADSGARD
jgi:hypothetical protein